MLTTTAAVLTRLNAPLEIMKLRLPALGVGQVLVRVKSASICGAQLGEWTGAKGADPYLPHLLGHEGSGVVQECGPGVKKVHPGDKVVLHWRKGGGIEAAPPVYHTEEGLSVGAGPVATFATYAIVSENRMTRIPGLVPFPIASLFGCGVTTGLGIVTNEAQLKLGESILVIGAGGVGLNVVQGALLAGAHPVKAVEPNPNRRALVEKMGASCFEDIASVDGRYDVVVDCTGIPTLIDIGLGLLSAGGRMILVGQPRVGASLEITNARTHYCGKTIMDSQGGLTNPDRDIPRYLQMCSGGRLLLDDFVGDTFELKDINAAFLHAQKGECAGRTMLSL